MQGARHDQAVSLLTGLERFVRLMVQRRRLVTAAEAASPGPRRYPPAGTSAFSPASYMANRPSYGGYRRHELATAETRLTSPAAAPAPAPVAAPTTAPAPVATPAPAPAAAPAAAPVAAAVRPVSQVAGPVPVAADGTLATVSPDQFQALIPAHFTQPTAGGQGPSVLVDRHTAHAPVQAPQFPPAPTRPGVWTESVTKSTFTETTTTRRTENKLVRPPPPTEVRPQAGRHGAVWVGVRV